MRRDLTSKPMPPVRSAPLSRGCFLIGGLSATIMEKLQRHTHYSLVSSVHISVLKLFKICLASSQNRVILTAFLLVSTFFVSALFFTLFHETQWNPAAIVTPVSTTTVTFDPSLIVTCRESPYIICSQKTDNTSPTNRLYQIAFLRRPVWFPEFDLNGTSCPYRNCQMNETLTPQTDLVFVYGVNLGEDFQLPQLDHQPPVALGVWESPVYTHSSFLHDSKSAWNSLVNLIVSYRVDSEVFTPYARLQFNPKPIQHRPDYYQVAKNKSKTAFWIVSNCDTQSKRELYVREMQKYIEVDIFGKCGRPCQLTDPCTDPQEKNQYMFYLSFENSLCSDYITEKFFKLFEHSSHVVPVVRGGADYKSYFPEKTFINAADFGSAKDLALHLQKLASDLKTYSQYLEYKDMYISTGDIKPHTVCGLCTYLNRQTVDLFRTYNLKSHLLDGHCHSSTDI